MRLPDPLRKGLLLYGDRTHAPEPPERLVDYGAAYESEGRISDALESFWRARFTEGMERIARRASDEGDYFLYRQAMIYLGRPMPAAELVALSNKAAELGKLSFALAAARQAGDSHLVGALEARIAEGKADEPAR
jgi:hypothetical protein